MRLHRCLQLETLTTAAKDAAKDFSRVLATAHACAADAAFALAAKVETKFEEENPGPGEGEELFSLAERAVRNLWRALYN